MSTKSPVSTICLVACAKRASSRSIGGMLKKPGRKNSAPQTIRNAIARAWLAVAKSSTFTSPRPGSPGSSARAALQIWAVHMSRPSVPHTTKPPWRQPVSAKSLLHSDHDCVRGTRGIHDGQADKAGPGRIDSRWRRPSISPTDTPFTSMVIGSTPPATFTGKAENCASPALAASIREPLSGNWMRGAWSSPIRTSSPAGRNRRSGSGSFALLAISVPFGAVGSAAAFFRCAQRRRTGSARRQCGRADPEPARRPAGRPRRRW